MEKISKSLKCIECNLVLDAPVVLPCGHSVCKHHTTSKWSHSCVSCAKEFPMPSYGFPPNMALEETIAEIQELDFGQHVLDLGKKLNEKIEKFANMSKHPDGFIDERISFLKNSVNKAREELKGLIDDMADEMIEELDFYHEDCIANSYAFIASSEIENLIAKAKVIYEGLSNNINQIDFNKFVDINIDNVCGEFIEGMDMIIATYGESLMLSSFSQIEKAISDFRNLDKLIYNTGKSAIEDMME